MIKISICEDEEIFITILESIIDSKLKSFNIDYTIDCYETGESLLKEIVYYNEKYDIYFFDIQLHKMDGIELATKIRSIDNSGVFIFITSLNERVYEVFELNTFDFIRKDYFEKEIEQVLDRLIANFDTILQKYTFNTQYEKINLKLRDILYFEIINRHVIIHTNTVTYTTNYRTIKELPLSLEDKYFFEIYRGIVVNLNYINIINGNVAILKSGVELPVSRRRLSNLRRVFLEFSKSKRG